MAEAIETKNLQTGNGGLDEKDPLRSKSAHDDEGGDDDPGPSVSEDEEGVVGGKKNKKKKNPRADTLGLWAMRCRLTPKKGLLYLIFCTIVILLLLFLLILLAALWPRASPYPPCGSPPCHLASARVLSSLNQSVAPCDQYWDYVCGGWLEKNPIPPTKAYWDVDALHQYNVKDKLRTIINTLPVSQLEEQDLDSVALKIKRFYDSCIKLSYINRDGSKELLKIIERLGGWSLIRELSTLELDFPRLLRQIQGEYRATPFFKVEVVPDIVSPSRSIIMISPAGLSLPHPAYYNEHNEPLMEGRVGSDNAGFGGGITDTNCLQKCQEMLNQFTNSQIIQQRTNMGRAFHTFAKDIAIILGAPSNEAAKFARDLYHFEKRIAEITPDPKNYTADPVTFLQKLSLSELRGMSNTIFWGEFLLALFPRGNVINDQTRIITPSTKYLVDVSGIISTTDKANLQHYLMWHLVQKLAPYLSKEYFEVIQLFQKESLGRQKSPPRWEFCVSEAIRFFPHGTDYLLASDGSSGTRISGGSSSERKKVFEMIREIFENIREAAVNKVNYATKYDESLRDYLLDKLRLMTLQIGSPLGTNRTLLKELYLDVQTQQFDFFTNVLSLTTFQGGLEQKLLSSVYKDSSTLSAIAKSPFAVQFIPSLDGVVVPEGVLLGLLLEQEQLPPSSLIPLLYGSLGVQIGEAISQAFGPQKGLYLTNGALMSNRDTKAEELKDIINSRRTCLSSFFINIRLDDEPYIESTSLDTTLHLSGVQLALAGMGLHAGVDYKTLPSLDYSPEALFFLSYGQSQCSAQTMLFHDYEHLTYTSLTHDHRVRGILRQLVAFTNAFQCSKSSEMYADFSCGSII